MGEEEEELVIVIVVVFLCMCVYGCKLLFVVKEAENEAAEGGRRGGG